MSVKKLLSYWIMGWLLCFTTSIDAAEKLPNHIKWETNDTAPVWADPNAKKGGTFRDTIPTFPLTIRMFGPDSNGSFARVLRRNQLRLISYHPDTEEILPQLATHWAFDDDRKTMYFKLDKRARWSDGPLVTADDFVFGLEFMRSKHIVSPWYNNFYTKEIEKLVKYDDHTIAIVATKPDPDLPELVKDLLPQPKHFYGELTKDFVRKYNWTIKPNTGPYFIDKIKKGKSITLKRKKDWWAKDLKYFKGRFNVDKIIFTVVRDQSTVFEYFKKNKVDYFSLTLPSYWHEKAKNLDIHQKGYAKKHWFYTNSREPPIGFWLNEDKEVFKDRNVRHAFAHAMNVEKLLKTLLRGDYARLHNVTTGFGKYTNPQIRARNFDIPKVEALMTQSGWKRGNDGIWIKGKMRYSVRVTYTSDTHTARLAFLKEEAKKAGVELNLQRLDGSAAFKSFLEKKHDVAWMGWSTGFRPQYWGSFHSVNAHKPQTNNITNTDDPEMDQLIDSYRKASQTSERIKLAHAIQEKVHEIGSFVPAYKVGYFRAIYWRWWQLPRVPATRSSESFFDLFADDYGTGGLFWLDPEIKKETQQAMKTGKRFDSKTLIDNTFKAN